MKKVILFLFVTTTLMFSSCKKDPIRGCTDPDSENYDASAEEDDNSCVYKGRLVFWYNESLSQDLITDNSLSLTYYVDNQVVGSSSTNVFWTGAPECGQNGSVTVEKDLGSSKTKSYSYKAVDQDGFEVFNGNVTFEANTCVRLQLVP